MVGTANSVDANTTGFQSLNAATGAWSGRTLTAGTGIGITNGTGTGGSPVFSAVSSSTVFYAVLTTSSGAVTGNGGIYTLGDGNGGTTTIVTNVGGSASTATTNLVFTAPATGQYLFGCNIAASGVTGGMTTALSYLLTSGGRTVGFSRCNGDNLADNATIAAFAGTVIIPLTAAETVTFQLQISGAAGNTATIVGSGVADFTYAYGQRIG